MKTKTTYYINLKSCSNAACETKELSSEILASKSREIVAKVQGVAKAWGLANGSTAVEVSAESFAGVTVVSQHVVAIDLRELRRLARCSQPAPKPKPVLKDVLVLDSRVKFWAVLEALQQYVDNGRDADESLEDEEFVAKLDAAEAFRDQLDAVLASLAE